MSNINFEEDQQQVIHKTDNIKTLADQVEKLNSLQNDIESQEGNLKKTKKQFDYLSGEVIRQYKNSCRSSREIKFFTK